MNSPDDFDLKLIRRAWSRLTSATPDEWTRESSARGQCAITACVMQDCLGGKLIRTMATAPGREPASHYANLLDNGVILDATASQFPEGTEFEEWEERTREYVLGYPATLARYYLLVQRINEVATLDLVRKEGITP